MDSGRRIILIIGAVAILLYMLFKIKNKRVQIHYAIYWTFFSGLIVILCMFPKMVEDFSELLGVEASIYLLFAIAAALVVIKLFNDTIKISELEKKIEILAQEIALLESEKGKTRRRMKLQK